MAIFMADRYLPDITLETLMKLRQSAQESSERSSTRGKPVIYLRTTFIPGDSRCLCFFESPNGKFVQEVNEAAQFPFTRIIPVVELT